MCLEKAKPRGLCHLFVSACIRATYRGKFASTRDPVIFPGEVREPPKTQVKSSMFHQETSLKNPSHTGDTHTDMKHLIQEVNALI